MIVVLHPLSINIRLLLTAYIGVKIGQLLRQRIYIYMNINWIGAGGEVVMVALFTRLYSRNVPFFKFPAFQVINELQSLLQNIYTVYT